MIESCLCQLIRSGCEILFTTPVLADQRTGQLMCQTPLRWVDRLPHNPSWPQLSLTKPVFVCVSRSSSEEYRRRRRGNALHTFSSFFHFPQLSWKASEMPRTKKMRAILKAACGSHFTKAVVSGMASKGELELTTPMHHTKGNSNVPLMTERF